MTLIYISQRATDILTEKRKILDALAARLEEKEVLSGEEVKEVIGSIGLEIEQPEEAAQST